MIIYVDGKKLEANSVKLVFEDMSPDCESLEVDFSETAVSTTMTKTILDSTGGTVKSKQMDIEEIFDEYSCENSDDFCDIEEDG